MATSATFSDSLLAPLDRVRSALFVRATRLSAVRGLLLDKQRRVPALLLAHAALALALAVTAPTFMLLLGPLVLGVPHVLSDLRYLVLRPAFSSRLRGLLLGGSALLLGARLLELAGLAKTARLELGGAGALLLVVALMGAPRLRSARVLVALVAIAALTASALVWPRAARLALCHAHNVLALLLWGVLFRRTWRRALPAALLILVAAGLLLATPLAWWGFRHGLPSAFGLHALAAADALAPGITDATLALGVVSSFAFLQSVHYAVWLHAVPQDATRGNATLTFRMSYRSLLADFGKPALLLATLLVLAVPAAGVLSPLRVQAAYLSLSSFHGYWELAALALAWVRPEESRACR
jgi:hypothetical protein